MNPTIPENERQSFMDLAVRLRDEHDVSTTFRCCECGVLTDVTVPTGVATKIPKDQESWERIKRRRETTGGN